MTRDVAAFIGNKLGKFKEVDLDSNGEVWGSSVRIQVSVDITKPLKRALKIRKLGDEHLVTFTYERLPNFCYLSGVLGHLSRQCEVQLQEAFCDPGEHAPYGDWLRAVAPVSFWAESVLMGTAFPPVPPVVPLLSQVAPFNPSQSHPHLAGALLFLAAIALIRLSLSRLKFILLLPLKHHLSLPPLYHNRL
ncbi:hypothetical protein Sango_2381000 [Sesamum angolense]|uniref:Zinc knuckle CX2CX4HX4C domain-containing protein n=1 Tax=Sesamum angolense TaxID=2727404 RepID=A0AAE1W6T0_9LAMI|nr:hypothetical protein Sango_2381000 [Sesamum angolense]